MPRYFSKGFSVSGDGRFVMRAFFFSGRLSIPYFGMEAVRLEGLSNRADPRSAFAPVCREERVSHLRRLDFLLLDPNAYALG
jgi:hypothetical protein